MSGGKGDKQSSTIKLPPEIEALAKRNLEGAEKAGKIGYVPFQGPTVAALNPMQVNAMQQNANAMKAFGMTPASVSGSIPKPTTYAGGVQGYDPMALYLQALSKINPWQKQQIEGANFVTPPPHAAAVGGGASGIPAMPGVPINMVRTPQQMALTRSTLGGK